MLRVRDVDPQRAATSPTPCPRFCRLYRVAAADRYAESKTSLREELDRLEADIEDTQSRIQAIGQATTRPRRQS